MAYECVFMALSDPTRRALMEALRDGPANVRTLAEPLPISRPAVSQHLKVLGDAGLVRAEAKGTQRLYSINQDGLATLRTWLDQMWDEALGAFAAEAHRQAKGKLP